MSNRKAALVTGAVKRIGKSISECLADKGYNLVLHYNQSAEEAEEFQKLISLKGVQCVLIKADLEKKEETNTLVSRAADYFPNLALLVNNASVFIPGKLIETGDSLLEKILRINLEAPFILSREFAKSCGKGQIINILDTKISRNQFGYFAYYLSKKSLAAMTRMAAAELAPDIRVNGIAPGVIIPPEGKDEEYLARILSAVPLGRKGNVGEIVSALSFFLSNEYVTGQILFIDGGQNL